MMRKSVEENNDSKYFDVEKGEVVEMEPVLTPKPAADEATFRDQIIAFSICFAGLQASYLTWGVMQELIMNTQFESTPLVPSGRFPSPTFCVFSNRIIAIVVAAALCYWKHGSTRSSAPLWVLLPCSISNTLSSFCQYASLLHVPFPLQNLFKSTKVIPVMLMGRFLKGTEYPWIQYGEAALITVGVFFFSQSHANDKEHINPDTGLPEETPVQMLGIFLLCGYVLTDSFTSQWQSKIYADYGRIDQYHMMFGVNFWSILLTTASLVFTGEVPAVLEFLAANPQAFYYNVITGLVSTTGQLFIFYTIKRFGPVALTITMTTRQMFSMAISCMLFGHSLGILAVAGSLVVFGTVIMSIRRQYLDKQKKGKQ